MGESSTEWIDRERATRTGSGWAKEWIEVASLVERTLPCLKPLRSTFPLNRNEPLACPGMDKELLKWTLVAAASFSTFQSKLLIINNLHGTKLLVHGLHNEWRPNFCLR